MYNFKYHADTYKSCVGNPQAAMDCLSDSLGIPAMRWSGKLHRTIPAVLLADCIANLKGKRRLGTNQAIALADYKRRGFKVLRRMAGGI